MDNYAESARRGAVAIVGIACRLPGGLCSAEAFWRALRDGADLLDAAQPRDTKRFGRSEIATRPGQLSDVDLFDPEFFGVSRGEARAIDPQQRMLLEVAWEACEDAGLRLAREHRLDAGVFIATHSDDYRILRARAGALDVTGQIGTSRSGAAGRISFAFNLAGPSLTIDSDRASSLVAVQLACRALRDGECGTAIVGASNLGLLDEVTAAFGRAGLLAPDGRCKFADARADGFVRSEATIALVLKPMEAALRDGERIYAVIRGCATRHGGHSTESFTAPSEVAHEEAIRAALAQAGVSPEDIAYVEAHGTGTRVGDPVELRAIGGAVGTPRPRSARCLVGSVKTNLGHTEAASGLVGLVKTALALHHGEIPASLHFQRESIDLVALGLDVPTEVRAWPHAPGARVAGISAIGLTGTVAHVVLGDAPAPEAREEKCGAPGALVLPLSAHREESLRELARAWAERLEADEADAVALCRTAAQRLALHPERLALGGHSARDLAAGLRMFLAGEPAAHVHIGDARRRGKLAFVFSGHGSQWLGMGRRLMDQPAFSAVVEECDDILRTRHGWSVLEELHTTPERSRFGDIAVVQPVLVVTQIALAALWQSWGFRPDAVVGASMGEVSAAYVAGALSLADAMDVICHRSRLLRTTAGMGRLVVVECTPDEALTALAGHEEHVSVSGFNSPQSVLLGGEANALARIIAPFERRGVFCRYVNIDATSHCPQVEAISHQLRAEVSHVTPRAETIPFYSTVTGGRLTGTALTPEYWRRNLREPVDFLRAVRSLLAEEHTAFLEASPHPMTWSSLMDSFASSGVQGLAVKSLKRDEDESLSLFDSVAALHAHGHTGDWRAILGTGRIAPEVPRYPFHRRSFWFSADPTVQPTAGATALEVEIEEVTPPADAGAAEALADIVSRWRSRLSAIVGRALSTAPERVPTDVAFRDMGLSSVMLAELRSAVTSAAKVPVGAGTLFDHPTIDALSAWIAAGGTTPDRLDARPTIAPSVPEHPSPAGAIAIVGLACRFPKSPNLDAFWELLQSGGDAITEIPKTRWDVDAMYDADPSAPGKMYSRWAGLIEDVEAFDAAFFGIAPREADAMDPQQRLLLEVSWTALEHAGIRPDRLAGTRGGMFVGMGTTGDYASLKGWQIDGSGIDSHDSTGNAASIAAGRVSYFLGLEGPAMTVDTACSSSLVAVHLAVRSLRLGESSFAIAAGVNLILAPEASIAYCKTRMLSPRGRCRTFDAGADGYVRGEGGGAVVLKRLDDALRDGDTIHAVIRGSAVNQDGKSNGLTAPSGRAQQRLIESALADAGVAPDRVEYLEAHGTGTPLGDPIELGAASAVLGRSRPEERPLVVGSVKTNIGHLEAAAGMAGLLKVVLAMRHALIPRHLHLTSMNPEIDPATPIVVPATERPWTSSFGTRVAGVSSFGFSGTNAHVVVESFEAPDHGELLAGNTAMLVPIAARTEPALSALVGRHADALAAIEPASFGDYAFTAATGRAHFGHRIAVVAATPGEAAERLRSAVRTTGLARGVPAGDRSPRVAFLFTGQGSQYDGMAQDLYEAEEVFRAEIERCSEIARPELGRSLRDILFGADRHLLASNAYAQPASFALQCAIVAQWRAFGVEPDAVLGHSLGEFAACVTAGVLSRESALHLVIQRGRLMGALTNAGSAAAAPIDAQRAEHFLAPHRGAACIAAYNAPESTLIGGETDAVAEIVLAMNREGIQAKVLSGIIGVHSPTMDPVLDELERAARQVPFGAPRVAVVSGLLGRDASGGELADPLYWRRHAREAVRYADGVRALVARGVDAFVEIGPRHTLLRLGQATAPEATEAAWLPSLSKERHDRHQLLESAAELYARGLDLDWAALHAGQRRRKVSVPAYPFARERHWIKPRKSSLGRAMGDRASWLGVRVQSPLSQVQFETVLSKDSPPTLTGHKLFGAIVVPGAAYVSRVVEAAATLGHRAIELRDMLFSRPMWLEGDSDIVSHLVLDPEGPGFRFELSSRPSDSNSNGWILHTSGTVRSLEVAPGSVRQQRADLEGGDTGETFYAAHAALGYDLSPEFRWIEHVSARAGNVIAELRPIPSEDRAWLPSGVLDSCLQLATRLDPEHPLAEDQLFMPVAIDALRVHPRIADERMTCTAKLVARGEHGDVTADLVVRARGVVVVEIDGLRMRRVHRSKIAGAHARKFPTAAYQVEWSSADRPSADHALRDAGSGWIVFSRGDVLGEAVTTELAALGEEFVVVKPGDSFRVRGDVYEIAPDSAADYERLLPEALARLRTCRGILHLWGVSPDVDWAGLDAEGLARAQRLGAGSLVVLAGALARRVGARTPKVWAVTQSAQRVLPSDPWHGILAAPIWGAGRVIAREHPSIWGGLIDLGPGDPSSLAETLMDEVWTPSGMPELAIRDTERFVPRLVHQPLSEPATRLDGHATYLITGGLGPLGLHVARFLTSRGARHLVLVGRRRHATAEEAIRGIEQAGAAVRVALADVTDAPQVAALVAEIDASGHPLRGIVHAAGVLDDAPVVETTPERFRRVMAPKIAGALALDRAVGDAPLDFFVLFSSVFGLLGNEGQVAYAAANAFLDRFAAERTHRGARTLSLSWGPWQGPGMAEHLVEHLYRRWGLAAIEPSNALEMLGRAFQADAPHLAILAVDGEQVAKHASGTLLASLATKPVAASGGASRDGALQDILGVPPQARRERLSQHVKAALSGVLGAGAGADWSDDQRLEELGMDSLLAMDLSRALQSSLTIALPPRVVFDHPTVRGLVGYLMETLGAAAHVKTDHSGA